MNYKIEAWVNDVGELPCYSMDYFEPANADSGSEEFESKPFGRNFGCELDFPTTMSIDELVEQLIERGHGVEIETIFAPANHVESSWTVAHDRSINGTTLMSPVLSGLEGLARVMLMCDSLSALGCVIPPTDSTCGFHVHVGARDLDGEDVARLISFHHHAERNCGLINCFPEKRRNLPYCKDTDEDILARAEFGPITFEEVREMAVKKYGAVQNARYVALNMVGGTDLGTVEFRRHEGTLDGKTCVAWILHCLCMVSASKKLRRDCYGAHLEECLDAMGMSSNGILCKWAMDDLLARYEYFAEGKSQYPPFPALLQER